MNSEDRANGGLRNVDSNQPVALAGEDTSVIGVLVVERDVLLRSQLYAGLRRAGFMVWVAADGPQGLALCAEHRATMGIALMDTGCPEDVHLCATLASFQQLKPELLCCFMTADPRPETEERLWQLGAAWIFQKPVYVAEVIRTVNRLVRVPVV
jgi:DNA-binding response OmpR family regulator